MQFLAPAKKPTKSRKATAKDGSPRIPKPVSAYALFFRDTQPSIKAETPTASFGEISKIVASKWELLKKEDKDVYKERADAEKRNYLQNLASSKAQEVADQQAAAQKAQKVVAAQQAALAAAVQQQQQNQQNISVNSNVPSQSHPISQQQPSPQFIQVKLEHSPVPPSQVSQQAPPSYILQQQVSQSQQVWCMIF